MRLKSLELYGFKSFADRTRLEFDEGLTVIVGPNGCGKSNIVDAIKWCLGEQRVTAIRGDQMADVIFKGNGSRAARNFAEVSMSFDNSGGALGVDYAEVVVTRRLFRSGESEYLINNQVVRLKDVRDLFLDTGLGIGAYSIMEQGRIDAILSANPIHRRRIFEEAAGISRYRSRRRESELKLDKVEQNLLRLGDVIDELEKQVRSLKNQAGRARSYLAAKERLAELKALFYRHSWWRLHAERAEVGGALREAVQVEAGSREELGRARSEVGVLDAELDRARGEVERATDAFRTATAALESLSQREGTIGERLDEQAARRTQLEDRARGLEADLGRLAHESQELEGRAASWTEEARVHVGRVESAQRARDEAATSLQTWTEVARSRRAAAAERVEALTRVRNERGALSSHRAAQAALHERIEERMAELRAELEAHGTRELDLFEGAKGLDAELEGASRRVERENEERGTLVTELERVESELGGVRERLIADDARGQVLAEMIARREGVSAGAVELLESSARGVVGLVAELVDVPPELAPAVEAALGANADAVLVETEEVAVAALAQLRDTDAARVRLLALDALSPPRAAASGRRLVDELELNGHRDVVEALLGHVLLVDDLDALARCPVDGDTVWVTPEGQMRDALGLWHGGRAAEGVGLLARRAELETQTRRVEEHRARVEVLERERERLLGRLSDIGARLEDATTDQRRIERERERTREREEQFEERRREIDRELALRANELARAEQELSETSRRLAAIASEEDALQRQVEEDRSAEEASETERNELAAALAARDQALHDARLEQSRVRERLDALRGEQAQLRRRVEERESELATAREEHLELERRRERLETELAEVRERAAELGEERDARAGEQARAREGVAELARRHAELVEREREIEAALGEATERVTRRRMALREVELKIDGLRQRVLEELEVDLAGGARLDAAIAAATDTEVPRADDAVGADSEPDADAEPDWAATEREIDELKARMARMGNVNLGAIDELADVEERLDFLTGQRDDLVHARGSLTSTISHLDRESRERFIATFDEVREHFRTIFRRLFQGGKADISLEEGKDVLEAGVEIVAAPPGKDARSINLLSGGERTLTATGLLFALFKARPSPVSILDEVDAALDETNIDRFCGVLETFLDESQFLVVTHSRRTMSRGDRIWGVTMQEHGVSKALTLSLSEADETTRQAVA